MSLPDLRPPLRSTPGRPLPSLWGAGPQQPSFALTGGGVLVAEVAVDKDIWSDRPGLLRALSRLLHAQGPERGLRRYRQMLEQHGFPIARTAHAVDILDLVLATRAAA